MASKRPPRSKCRTRSRTDPMGRQSYDPTPAEIDRACVKIQAGWSEAEKAKRLCGETLVRWELPMAERVPCDRCEDE